MSKLTNDEIGAKLEAWRESHNRHRATLVERMENEARAFLEAPATSDEEKKSARMVLSYCSNVRREADCTKSPIPDAVLAGAHYEHMRQLPLKGPAETGTSHGIHWGGKWIEITPLEKRIAEFIDSRLSHSGTKIGLNELVRECWSERYNAGRRGKYRKVFSMLNAKFLNNDINVELIVRGDHVVVEYGNA